MSQSALLQAEAEVQLLRAMLIDSEARVQAAETAAAADLSSEALEAAEAMVRHSVWKMWRLSRWLP